MTYQSSDDIRMEIIRGIFLAKGRQPAKDVAQMWLGNLRSYDVGVLAEAARRLAVEHEGIQITLKQVRDMVGAVMYDRGRAIAPVRRVFCNSCGEVYVPARDVVEEPHEARCQRRDPDEVRRRWDQMQEAAAGDG